MPHGVLFSHFSAQQSEIALFYTESNTIDVESILSNNDGSPNMVGFVVPHERDNNYR